MQEKSSVTQRATNRKIWRTHLKARINSGLSRAEYCRRQNLSYHAFKYWEKKLSPKKHIGATFIPVPTTRIEQNSLSHKELAKLKIDLGNRLKIEVHDGFTSATLSRVISTLKAC